MVQGIFDVALFLMLFLMPAVRSRFNVSVFTGITGDGHVAVLENTTVHIAWHHLIPELELIGCYFSYFIRNSTNEEEFLHYNHLNETGAPTGRIVPPTLTRGKKWFLDSEEHQCRDGIIKNQTEWTDDGIYMTTIITSNKTILKSPEIDVKVYKVSDIKYSITMGNITRNLSLTDGFDIELDILDGNNQKPMYITVQLAQTCPKSTVLAKINQGTDLLNSTNCTLTRLCEVNLTQLASMDYDLIRVSIDTGIQGLTEIRIQQGLNYTLPVPPKNGWKGGIIAGIVIGVLIIVIIIIIIIIMRVVLKSKRENWNQICGKDRCCTHKHDVREEQFDGVLIYSEKDVKMAVHFKDILEKFIVLEDEKPPSICVLDRNDSLQHIKSRFKRVGFAMDRSTYMLLLMTRNFVEDDWAEMQKDEALTVSLENSEKKWCVIPLHTVPKEELRYPYGLQALTGIDISAIIPNRNIEDVAVSNLSKTDLNDNVMSKITDLFNRRLDQKRRREQEKNGSRPIVKKNVQTRTT